jgi:hypothetical protein
MVEEVGRVLIDSVGACAFEFRLAVPAAEQADTESLCTLSCEKVPDAIADDQRIGEADAELARA